MSNKHDINPYDRLFLKTLDYGDMLPMAVIKNYDNEVQEAFERRIITLLGRVTNEDINFGSVRFDEDEYYIAACKDSFTRSNLISQGRVFEQIIGDDNGPLNCKMFDVENDLMEAGVAPVMRFEIKANADSSMRRSLVYKMCSSVVKMPDFELYLVSIGDEKTIFVRQTGMGEILSFYDKAKVLALDILSDYRGIITNVYKLEIDGKCCKNPEDKKNFAAAQKSSECVSRTFEKEIFRSRAERCITAADLCEIRDIDFGKDRVVVSVLKNSWVSFKNLRRICEENKSISALGCELSSLIGQNGDKFILFVVNKGNAAKFVIKSAEVESKLLNSSSKSFTIKMMNIDSKGKVTPADVRLVARLKTKNQTKLKELEELFSTDEQFEKLNPEIVKYGSVSYGVYVRNFARSQNKHMMGELPMQPVHNAIMASGIEYELTDAYGVVLPGAKNKSQPVRRSTQNGNTVVEPSVEMEK